MHLLLRTLAAIVAAGALAFLAARRTTRKAEEDAHRQAEMDDWATADIAGVPTSLRDEG